MVRFLISNDRSSDKYRRFTSKESGHWQYIHSGAQHPQFGKVLSSLITEDQGQRIQLALATLQ